MTSIEKLKEELEQCKQQIEAWEGLNKHIWKKNYVRAIELENQILKLERKKPEPKPKPESKPKIKKKLKPRKKRKYKSSDVNKDGKVDFKDVVKVAKDALRGK